MSNWNLKTFDNIYAALAQSAYTGRPVIFDYNKLSKEDRRKLQSGQSIKFDFSQDARDKNDQVTEGGGTDLPNGGVVYLQPDQEGLLELDSSADNTKKAETDFLFEPF